MSLFHAYQGRGISRDVTIVDGSGNAITPGANDVIRAVIGREGRLGTNFADAELEVASDSPTANGSTFTKGGGGNAAVHRLRLDADDLTFQPGVYTLFIDMFDRADSSEWKNVQRQVFTLEET